MTRRSPVFATVLASLLLWQGSLATKFNIDDSTLYAIKFNPTEEKLVDNDDALLKAPGLLQTVTMTTSHNEKYVCQLPNDDIKSQNEEDGYEGPSVLQLLERLFVQSKCAYRLEHYWTYELCHGKHLKQYHEEREGKGVKVTEYYLGHYNKEIHDAQKKEWSLDQTIRKKPLKKKIESYNMPYFEVIMRDGTLCDLNGQPRLTRVHYVCYPNGHSEIFSLKEASTCEYEVVILTDHLCSHPDYRPEESNERLVNCKPANENTASKPLNLIAMEAESLKLRSEKMYQAELFQGDQGPGSVRIEIKPVLPTAEGSATQLADQDHEENKEENWPESVPRQPMKPLMDPQVVQEFLLGQFCLYGGSGWWKYEFCYGQKVDQYHEEKGGNGGGPATKTVINLGRFDMDKHIQWIKDNPNKRPKPVESRKHVSHFYSDGDICDITGKPRHVEVKLKCRKSDSPSSVSIFLLEPKTCEYVLGVESPLVCDILASADENGLMKMSSKSDFEKMKPEMVKFTLEDAIIAPKPEKQIIEEEDLAASEDYDDEDE